MIETARDTTAQRFGTRAIHAGQSPDPITGAVMTPIYATSTYVQSSPGVHKGFDYGRIAQPDALRARALRRRPRRRRAAFAFASGLAAIATVLELLDAGSHVVAGDDLYGGTFRLFDKVRQRSAGPRRSRYVDLDATRSALEAALRPDTRTGLGRDADQPDAQAGRPARGRRVCRARGIVRSPTTRSRPRTSSGRSSSASTSSCTRRPST